MYPLGAVVSVSQSNSFLLENRPEQSLQIFAQDKSLGRFRNVGTEHLRQLRGEATPARITAVKHAACPQFTHRHLREASSRIAASQICIDVFVGPDGAQAASPIT